MTDQEQKEIYDAGWNGYFNGKRLDEVPDYPEQEKRDEWSIGWLSALNWSESDSLESLGLTTPEDVV